MSSRVKSLLIQIGSVILGAVLLWLALRSVSFADLSESLRNANYLYLIPLIVLALGSHLIRAWRWRLLVGALPEYKTIEVRLNQTFGALMIGYMVNYAAPRLGEIARSGSLSKQSGLPFVSILGTVVAERILDVISLAVGFLFALAFAGPTLMRLSPLLADSFDGVVPMWLFGLLLLIGILVAVLAFIIFRKIISRSPESRLAGTLTSFKDGFLSLIRIRERWGLLISTVAIWLCYGVLAWLPLLLLGIDGLTLGHAWILLIVGSAAMVIPTPGGIGSFHFITILTMTSLFAVSTADASAYAILIHGMQLVLYTIVGLIFLILQGRSLAALTETPETA